MNRPLTPSLSPSDGERVAGGRVRGWFMVPMLDSGIVDLVAADVRRLIPFGLKEVGASSRRLLRFRGSMRELSSL